MRWRAGPRPSSVDKGASDPAIKRDAAAFRGKLAPLIEHARKAGQGQRRWPGRTAASRGRSASIRAWAKDRASWSARARPR
jgi:hypothetical protein